MQMTHSRRAEIHPQTPIFIMCTHPNRISTVGCMESEREHDGISVIYMRYPSAHFLPLPPPVDRQQFFNELLEYFFACQLTSIDGTGA